MRNLFYSLYPRNLIRTHCVQTQRLPTAASEVALRVQEESTLCLVFLLLSQCLYCVVWRFVTGDTLVRTTYGIHVLLLIYIHISAENLDVCVVRTEVQRI